MLGYAAVLEDFFAAPPHGVPRLRASYGERAELNPDLFQSIHPSSIPNEVAETPGPVAGQARGSTGLVRPVIVTARTIETEEIEEALRVTEELQ